MGNGYEARPPARMRTASGGQVSVTSIGYVRTITVTDKRYGPARLRANECGQAGIVAVTVAVTVTALIS